VGTILITGTDTDVGKTYVSSLVLRALAAAGRRCAGLKPIASGCESDSMCEMGQGTLINADALALMAASSVKLSYAQSNPYAFEPAIAPHLAARAAGVKVDLARIVAAVRAAESVCDDVIVEGAGGWLSPLADGFEHADLAKALGVPVLLVVVMRLGCINHARLTASEIARSGVRLIGWVANILPQPSPMLALEENIASLIELLPVPLLARVQSASLHDLGLSAAILADGA
jgi:dethiobiotin synthetase